MFSFHKNDSLPRSRQSSIDSLVTGSTTSTTASDFWMSQNSSPSNAGMYSPESQHRTHPGKRSSVFNLRSRSNTATSTTHSMLSMSHYDAAGHNTSVHNTTNQLRQLNSSSHSDGSGTGTRRSFFRGKKGKRLSDIGTFGLNDIDNKEANLEDKQASLLRKGRRRNIQSEDSFPNFRHRISRPFDFQHITHTDRHQLAAIEKASGGKSAAGFWAVQASRPPSRGDTGIRTDDLRFKNFSSENLAAVEDRSASALIFGSPLQSPQLPYEWQQPMITSQPATAQPSLRPTRSVESFSQPGVSPRRHHCSQTIVGPPRVSSLPPLAPFHDNFEVLCKEEMSTPRRSTRSKRESGVWDSFTLGAAFTPEQMLGVQEASSYFGHAVTTPDDSAIHTMTPPFSPSLADVAEEPERYVSPRPDPRPPVRTPTTPKSPRSPFFESISFINQHSSNTRPRTRGCSHPSPKPSNQRSLRTRPMSQMSETLGSAGPSRRNSIRRPSATTRRKSNTWRAIEESWEDDVDYIYENALEADCDFEWDRASEDDTADDQQYGHASTPLGNANASQRLDSQTHSLIFQSNAASPNRFSSGDFRTSLLVPNTSSVPELVPTYAVSASTTSTGLATPSELFNTNHFEGTEGLLLSPSLLVPQEYKDAHEVTYEDLLDEYNGSDHHFPMLDAARSTTSSARSSHVRSSRRSSYDSSLISSTQSSGLWSSQLRRSASSAGSVPELMPSRRSRKEVNFALVIDQLSDQVASLQHFYEDKGDNDVTPPAGRTFFASDEETQDTEQTRQSIELEVRTSLELARRGSQPNNHRNEGELNIPFDLDRHGSQRSIRTPASHHKQALSEGAAELLSTPTPAVSEQRSTSRNRAATTTHVRQPMLSLFPIPPRHTPAPTRF